MPGLDSTLEIERIKNLIINFNWEIIKQEITDDNITLKIRKPKLSSITDVAGSVGAD